MSVNAFEIEAHLKCVVIARYFQLCIAISRVTALQNSIARDSEHCAHYMACSARYKANSGRHHSSSSAK